MPVPSDDSVFAKFDVCHNTFVNGKAVFDDIYLTDKNKWVSSGAACIGCSLLCPVLKKVPSPPDVCSGTLGVCGVLCIECRALPNHSSGLAQQVAPVTAAVGIEIEPVDCFSHWPIGKLNWL